MARRYPAGIIAAGTDPVKAPDAPTLSTPTPGDGQLSVPFTAPANIGGSAISGYTATSTPGPISTSATSSPITVTGLTNSTLYTTTATATNSYGISPSSNSVTGTPFLAVEDVFSTWIYTGNAGTQTITNGINFSGQGGMLWLKKRDSGTADHWIADTVRGNTKFVLTNATNAEITNTTILSGGFTTSGFGLGNTTDTNTGNMASWSFRKAPKFFDVLTYSGNGSNTRSISHNLGSVPGWVVIKRTDSTGNWFVAAYSPSNNAWYQTSTTLDFGFNLTNETNSLTGAANNYFTATTVNLAGMVSDFSLNATQRDKVNANGASYVMYLFANDTSANGIIQCGNYTGTGTVSGPTVTLGWEPQFVLIKRVSGSTGQWQIMDNTRGIPVVGSADATLQANSANTETAIDYMNPSATGFQVVSTDGEVNATGSTYIYLAIRRGPMKTPTVGTSVFQPIVYTGTNVDNRLVTTGIVTDMAMARIRGSSSTPGFVVGDRMRGNPYLATALTNTENTDADSLMTPTVGYGNAFSAMNGFGVGNDATANININTTSNNQLAYAFRRAPGFFDIVCYTGNNTNNRAIPHSLGVVPELIIARARSVATNWHVYTALTGITQQAFLNASQPFGSALFYNADDEPWGTTAFTSTNFYVNPRLNINTARMIAYLFASCPGVSKVGFYRGAGTGTPQTIDCGFTTGARFVMVKRADGIGDWWVWDSARGIGTSTEPHLYVNTTAAEVTTNDYIAPANSGFTITASAPSSLNDGAQSYIFLAVA